MGTGEAASNPCPLPRQQQVELMALCTEVLSSAPEAWLQPGAASAATSSQGPQQDALARTLVSRPAVADAALSVLEYACYAADAGEAWNGETAAVFQGDVGLQTSLLWHALGNDLFRHPEGDSHTGLYCL